MSAKFKPGRGPLAGIPRDSHMDAAARSRFLVWLQRRTVALGLIAPPSAASTVQPAVVASGFAIEHRGRLLWASAGHVLEPIADFARRGVLGKYHARWFDLHAQPGAASIPTSLEGRKLEFDEKQGTDIGIIEFTAWEADALRRNPDLEPFTKDDVPQPEEIVQLERALIVGWPADWQEMRRLQLETGSEVALHAEPIALPITGFIDPRDREGEFWQREFCVYGSIELDHFDGERPLHNIGGLSGSPVVGIHRREDGTVLDKLIGVQSSWLPQSRVVRVERSELMFALLDRMYDSR